MDEPVTLLITPQAASAELNTLATHHSRFRDQMTKMMEVHFDLVPGFGFEPTPGRVECPVTSSKCPRMSYPQISADISLGLMDQEHFNPAQLEDMKVCGHLLSGFCTVCGNNFPPHWLLRLNHFHITSGACLGMARIGATI